MTDSIGYLAAALTTISFVPQVLKVVRTRHTRDLSLAMYAIFACGVTCWLIYGVALAAAPIVLANAITLLLALVILAMKLRYG